MSLKRSLHTVTVLLGTGIALIGLTCLPQVASAATVPNVSGHVTSLPSRHLITWDHVAPSLITWDHPSSDLITWDSTL